MMVEMHTAGWKLRIISLRNEVTEQLGALIRHLPSLAADTPVELRFGDQTVISLQVGELQRVALYDGRELVAEGLRSEPT